MKRYLPALLLALAHSGARAAEPADTLTVRRSTSIDEVVVTGTRHETDIRHLPMSVSIIDRSQIEQSLQPSLLPLLTEQIPGLFVTARGVMG
ncbi:MAG: TonB-dependent receptor, partial [Alistipes sp.]|nr:TonB-dependent receptor [Alistipes sp.]